MQIYVSPSPHVRSPLTTTSVMRDVLIALCPACAVGIIAFGWRAALVLAVCTASAVLTEYALKRLLKKPCTIGDLSAAVTGLLLGLSLPPSTPWAIAAIGAFFAIAVVKVAFGGLGNNFVNPALAARAFLVACWPVRMTQWTANGFSGVQAVSSATDTISGATPLAQMAGGQSPPIMDLFLGTIRGTVGEISALALLAGLIYLLIRHIITPIIPLTYILSVFAASLFCRGGVDFTYATAQVLSGGLVLGACFMATDYTTSPSTLWGQVIMGTGCGLITVLIRQLGGYPEGVTYAILLMNLLTPLVERFTRPRAYGEGRKAAFVKKPKEVKPNA